MFDLRDAQEESTTGNNDVYQKVGVYENLKISDVTSGESTVKRTPFIVLHTVGENGEKGSTKEMYLSTTVNEGKQASAWTITARNLVNIIKNVTNKSEDDAKAAINAGSISDLVQKLSTLLVGKPFRGVFYGKEIAANGEGKKNWIKAHLQYTESMKVAKSASKLKFDETNPKHLEKLVAADTTTASSTAWGL